MDTFKLLQELSESPGPSGHEGTIAAAVERQWRPLVDEISLDRVGSLSGLKRATPALPAEERRFSVLLAAHQDEIGMMVTKLEEHNGFGFVRITSIGGVDRRHLFGQLAVVHGRRDLPGVIGALPTAMLHEQKREAAYAFEDLVIDVGLPFDALRELVHIGDIATFQQPLRKLGNGKLTGKALDNRASIAAVTVALQHLQKRNHRWDVIAVATVQEEVTYLGGYTSGHAHYPDVAIAIDVTHAKGPGSNDSELPDLGSGPSLDIGPNIHPGVYAALRSAAEALEMSVTVGTHTRGSGTDAYPLQVAREGIPTGLVSIPLRYMHTMVETADSNDIERVGRLLAEFIARLDESFIGNLQAEMMDGGATNKG